MSAPPWCRGQLGGTSVTSDPDPEERREEDQQAGEMLRPASPLLFLTHHSFSRDYGRQRSHSVTDCEGHGNQT